MQICHYLVNADEIMKREFIKKPNPVAAKDIKINQLEAQIRVLEQQLRAAKCDVIAAQNECKEMQEACPECDDICALEVAIDDAYCDVNELQRIYVDELACGAKMPAKMECKGLSKELCLLREIVHAAMCESEFDLAICKYNLAFCHAQNAPEYIAERKCLLETYIECNPDIDERCLNYINKVLLCACA